MRLRDDPGGFFHSAHDCQLVRASQRRLSFPLFALRRNSQSFTGQTMTADTEEKVDRLIHDADRAAAGADFARKMGDGKAATELYDKATRLAQEADALDPDRKSPAWKE